MVERLVMMIYHSRRFYNDYKLLNKEICKHIQIECLQGKKLDSYKKMN
ncbi:MAG: hypothetical protein FD141_762 [Fusobacteria bacterium]|nr:MAG: hypothetical protein FD141_762 [Fusobacteriota bacterium]KAF0228572.1 MAG: hypothetical protein FD182_828 [Fusobacteriota bacterium]